MFLMSSMAQRQEEKSARLPWSKPNINIPGIFEDYSHQLTHTQPALFTFGLEERKGKKIAGP